MMLNTNNNNDEINEQNPTMDVAPSTSEESMKDIDFDKLYRDLDNSDRCTVCGRSLETFENLNGMKIHFRQLHMNKKNTNRDENYLKKRVANTKSVKKHRMKKPKLKMNDLETNTNLLIEEAVKFEELLRAHNFNFKQNFESITAKMERIENTEC